MQSGGIVDRPFSTLGTPGGGSRPADRYDHMIRSAWKQLVSSVETALLVIVAAIWALLGWMVGVALALFAIVSVPLLLMLGVVALALFIQLAGVVVGLGLS